MPIRLKDAHATAPFVLGTVDTTLADAIMAANGTHTVATTFTGSIATALGDNPSNIQALFVQNPTVTGSVATTLGDFDGEFLAPTTLRIALAGCSQTEHWVGDEPGIDGYRQRFPANAGVFTSAIDFSMMGALKDWADSASPAMDRFRTYTTGNEDAILFQVCTQRFTPVATATDMTNAINNLKAEVPGVPVYLMPLDVAGPNDAVPGGCNQASYDLSVSLIDGAIAAGEALQGPEIMPLYDEGMSPATETSDGCHPNETGTLRAGPIIETWVQERLAPYDLSSFNIPFATNWPNEPVITRDATAADLTEFNTEAAVQGTRITITAPFTGILAVAANDIEVVCPNNIIIGAASPLWGTGVSFPQGHQRFKWTGGTILMGDSATSAFGWQDMQGVTDHLWDDVAVYGIISYDDDASNNGCHRIAWINSTIDHSANAEEFCFITQTPTTTDYSDFILANVRMEGDAPESHSTTRIQNCTRLTVVDCAFNMGIGRDGFHGPDPMSTGFRLTSGCEDVFIQDTSIGGRFYNDFLHGGFTYACLRLTAINVTRYMPSGLAAAIFDTSGAIGTNTGTVNGCNQFIPTGNGNIGNPLGIANYTGSNPVLQEWVNEDPLNLPDVSGVGAVGR